MIGSRSSAGSEQPTSNGQAAGSSPAAISNSFAPSSGATSSRGPSRGRSGDRIAARGEAGERTCCETLRDAAAGFIARSTFAPFSSSCAPRAAVPAAAITNSDATSALGVTGRRDGHVSSLTSAAGASAPVAAFISSQRTTFRVALASRIHVASISSDIKQSQSVGA